VKKIFPLVVLGMLVLTGFAAVAAAAPEPQLNIEVRSGFGLHIVIDNVGTANATDVGCTLFIDGGWIGPAPNSAIFNLGTIAPGQSVKAHFKTFGFGIGLFSDPLKIKLQAYCDEQTYTNLNKNAIILGRVIILT